MMAAIACDVNSEKESIAVAKPTPSVTATPKPPPTMPKEPTLCELQTVAIQEAVFEYHDKQDKWPTFDGKPDDIQWTKLVPDLLANEPSTDYQCDWQVDDDPEGTVCLPPKNYC